MEDLSEPASGSHSCTIMSDAGMCALWNPEQFATIVDYDTWANELSADDAILRRVEHGDLVPLNLGFDSGFGVTVRIGPLDRALLTERERRCLYVSSDPYLYVSAGELCASGLEHVGADPAASTTTRIGLAPGRYQVTVHLLDWEAEPGAKDESGRPTAQALPDFVALVSPEPTPSPTYRLRLETFDRPR